MPRPIWEGLVSFGLLQVPVALYPAESREEIKFHLLDERDMSHVKYRKVSEATGEEVPQERIVRAFELSKGEFVVVDDADFERADARSAQMVEIESFVDKDAIDPAFFDRPYYLVPGKLGEKGFVLLRETLARSNKTGIARVVIKTRQHLAALMPRGQGLILNLLRFPHELRPMDDLKLPQGGLADYKISDREIDMAVALVEMMAAPWEPAKYRDDYHDKLLAWIERKAREGAQVHPPEVERKKTPAVVVDFMELLKKSMEAKATAGRETGGGGKPSPASKRGKAESGPKTAAKGRKAAGGQ